MIQTIISTVGTSLLTNLKRAEETHKLRQLHDAKNWPGLTKELALLKPDDRICGAEINSLDQLMRRGGFQQISCLHFCVSDTEDGKLLGTLLKGYYGETHPDFRVEVQEIADLSSENPERFKVYGLRNLARTVGKLVRNAGDSRYVAFNCTGGYKAQVAIAVLMGQALGVDVYYKHETFAEIISFPRMPISFDYTVLSKNGDLLTALESGGELEATEEEIEPIRSLLEEVEVDGRMLWALAPIGQIFLEGFRKQFPPERILPAAVCLSDRKEPTFGDDHHYPSGFKEFVNKVWRETPYIRTCRTIPYAGNSAIRDRRFKVLSESKIIGEFFAKFGARFEILTDATSGAELSAVVMDLSQRFGA